jgi:serine/threonine-protein kinase
MEFVDGEPLYKFCDRNRLEVVSRLRLFQKICSAVDAAHRINVVHRDLKPSNILVKANGIPKLLDFGIAKMLDPDESARETEPTATALRMMTPEYASPEQVTGEPVSAASDVYSLGVLLFELMTGRRPYRMRNRALHEIHRAVCEEPPHTPSESLDEAENVVGQADDVFASRSTNRDDLRLALAGDLDKIILKSLRKDPVERYQSAKDLSADIGNYIENRPVAARSLPAEKPFGAISKSFSYSPTTGESRKDSIAILPFRTLSVGDSSVNTGDSEEFLGIGLADALVTRLSVIKKIIVRPTSSVLAFNVPSVDAFVAGRELAVDFIVDGTIRRFGNRIRVTVQLLSVEEGSTIWAQTFDENFTDLLDVEDSISARVAESLAPHLAGEEQQRFQRRGTNNVRAYEAFLRGRFLANRFSDESLVKSIECYHEAIAIDPGYALPYVGIADFFVWSAVFGKIPCRDAYPQAKAAIERALEIDDLLGEAFALKAFIVLLYDWNWPECERLVKRALDLNPNFGFAHECYSNFFATQGIFDEAIWEIRRAEELDPMSQRAKLMTSWTLYIARRFPEAIAKAHEANRSRADFTMAHIHLGYARSMNGELDAAISNLRFGSDSWPNGGMPRFMLCFALARAGRVDEARDVIAELKEIVRTAHVKPYYLAMAHAAVGDHEAAFDLFEKSLGEREEWMIWFGVDAHLDRLREHPRYKEILSKTNNPICRR